MNDIKVKTGCFTPHLVSDRKDVKALFLILTVFGLSGCVTSRNLVSLAPSPPELRFTTLYYGKQSAETEAYLSAPKQEKKELSAAEVLIAASGIGASNAVAVNMNKTKEKSGACKIKDRFDRKAVLAYEWGENRVAFNVSGVNMGGVEDGAFKLVYRLKLQPEKTRAEKCRYKSSWQGLIGSGYNEFFLREEDTIYEEYKEMRKKIQNYVDGAF